MQLWRIHLINNIFSQFPFIISCPIIAGNFFNDIDKAHSGRPQLWKIFFFRVIAAPVQIEIHEKTTSSASSITACITAAKFILIECLYNPLQTIPLVSFSDYKLINTAIPNITKPNFKLSIKHMEKSLKHMSPKRSCPKTDLL